ncbi:winged helix-turn-helix domain-containing protein [Aureimonas frigidaquae]|uniref:Putative transcriptional regulator, ModE family n=1 Tax=Aureimonas frigidaquae TaxID=424757 RepID=A0A0P0Z0C2_9HYPH|nr:LysR family transcriptional regulator [Aureimonas frigidaquae]BAT27302.1 putative transcriptional regulator, ModE family [Aureimonas frigidaquae]
MARISLKIYFDDQRLGPGKVDLLERIATHGSIAAAGRSLGMSYKRAWTLVAETDAIFGKPTVERQHGGSQGGGARLSPLGETIVREYRLAQRRAEEAIAGSITAIEAEREARRPG